MKISKVELLSGGLKGLRVWFKKDQTISKEGTFQYKNDVTFSRPVVKGLRDEVGKLRPYFAGILGLSNIHQKFDILSVKVGDDGFGFKARVSCNYTTFDVEPEVVDEGYPKVGVVKEIIESIFMMAEEHLAGKGGIDAKQYLLDFQGSGLKGSKDFADVDFESMPAGELREKMIEALEKSGCIVISDQDKEPVDQF